MHKTNRLRIKGIPCFQLRDRKISIGLVFPWPSDFFHASGLSEETKPLVLGKSLGCRRCKTQRITSQSMISKCGLSNPNILRRDGLSNIWPILAIQYDISVWHGISLEYLVERWFEQYPNISWRDGLSNIRAILANQ